MRTNFMNTILFYPVGLFGSELLPNRWKYVQKAVLIGIIFALMSLGIEFCQYRYALGLAEVDDVIHNTLGALLGTLAGLIPFEKIILKFRKRHAAS